MTADRVAFRVPSAQNPRLLTVGHELCFVPGDPSPDCEMWQGSAWWSHRLLTGRKDAPRGHPHWRELVTEGLSQKGKSAPDFRVSSLSFAEEFIVFTVVSRTQVGR